MDDIFRVSREETLIPSPNPYLRPALNDLLHDPQGSFFVDDDQYADIEIGRAHV